MANGEDKNDDSAGDGVTTHIVVEGIPIPINKVLFSARQSCRKFKFGSIAIAGNFYIVT